MYEAKVCVNPPVSKAVKSPRAGNSNRILVIIVLVNTHYGPVVQGHTRKSWDPLYKVACASMRGHGFLLGFHFRNKMKRDCHARYLKRITRRIAQKVENRQDHTKAITFHLFRPMKRVFGTLRFPCDSAASPRRTEGYGYKGRNSLGDRNTLRKPKIMFSLSTKFLGLLKWLVWSATLSNRTFNSCQRV